jgi:hypothetical protein
MIALRFPDGDYVYVQTAEGELQPPQLATATISRNNSDIAFTVTGLDKSAATFKGKMTEQALTGTFENGWQSRSGDVPASEDCGSTAALSQM